MNRRRRSRRMRRRRRDRAGRRRRMRRRRTGGWRCRMWRRRCRVRRRWRGFWRSRRRRMCGRCFLLLLLGWSGLGEHLTRHRRRRSVESVRAHGRQNRARKQNGFRGSHRWTPPSRRVRPAAAASTAATETELRRMTLVPFHRRDAALFDGERELAVLERQRLVAEQVAPPAGFPEVYAAEV